MKTISRFLALILLLCAGNIQAQSVVDSLLNEGYIPMITDVSQLSSPYTEPYEGSLNGLIDNDPNTFWHSKWHDYNMDEQHYLQIELADLTTGDFILYMQRREATNDHPTRVRLDFCADTTFTDCATFEVDMPQTGMTFHGSVVASEAMTSLQIPSKYVRVTSIQTNSGRVFWHAAELQLYCRPLVEDSTFRTEMEEYMSSLEEYAAFKEEMQVVYDEYLQLTDSATIEERSLVIAKIRGMKSRIQRAQSAIDSISVKIAEIDTLSDLNSYSELKEALNVAKTISTASTTTEVFDAERFLNQEWAVYCAFHTNMDEWNFSNYYNLGGFSVYLDNQNKVSQVYFNQIVPCIDNTLTIPRLFEVNGEFFPVVYITGGNWESSSSRDSVEHIVLPNTIQYIGGYAFGHFDNLKKLVLPASVKKVASHFVYSSDRLRIIDIDGPTPILDAQVSMPNTYAYLRVPGKYLDEYLDHQFWGMNRVISKDARTIEVTLTEQGDLGWHILVQEEDIRKVNRLLVKSGTLNTEDWQFLRSIRNLMHVDISACSNTEIPYEALKEAKIDSIILPKSLTTINDYAFQGSGIHSIVIPEKVTSIGNESFYNCDNLDTVRILSTENYIIEGRAFYDCDQLRYVEFSEGLNYIGGSAFYSCGDLKSVTFPSTLNSIGGSAFRYCSSLSKINFKGVTKAIEEHTFASCNSLIEINLNEGLEVINRYAFAYCDSLKHITLPSSLQKCVGTPFTDCNNLRSITLRSVIAPDAEGACPVSGVDLDLVTLYVPKISKIEYQLAGGWSSILNVVPTDYMPEDIVVTRDFTFRMEMDSTDISYNPNFALVWSGNVKPNYNVGALRYNAGNLKVHTAGKLNANKFSMYYSPYAKYYYDYEQIHNYTNYTQYNTTSLIVKGDMRAESTEIILMNRNNRWQFVSFPFDVKMSDIVPQNDSTQWVIREYSGANRAEGLMDETWQNIESTGVLKAGKGYIMHCFSTHEPVLFSVTPDVTSVTRQNIFESEDITMPLEHHESEFEHNMSWNLIGNPYPAFFDMNFSNFKAPFTVWDSYNNRYVAIAPGDDNYVLSPGESFFVQCSVDQDSITFAADGRQNNLEIRDTTAQSRNLYVSKRNIVNLSIEGEGTADRTRVVINEGAKMDYEMHCDAGKFGAMDENSVLLYTMQGNTRFAINERPLASGRVMMGVSVGETGSYTLSAELPEGMTAVIEDNATGQRTEIGASKDYSFYATKGDYNNRFTLHISAAGETDIEKVETEQQDEAPAYNVAGQRINAKDAKGVVIQDAKKVIK